MKTNSKHIQRNGHTPKHVSHRTWQNDGDISHNKKTEKRTTTERTLHLLLLYELPETSLMLW